MYQARKQEAKSKVLSEEEQKSLRYAHGDDVDGPSMRARIGISREICSYSPNAFTIVCTSHKIRRAPLENQPLDSVKQIT